MYPLALLALAATVVCTTYLSRAPAQCTGRSAAANVAIERALPQMSAAPSVAVIERPPPSVPQDIHTVEQAKIAIIIDDIGDQWTAGTRAVELPGQVTLALLPFTAHGPKLAKLAQQHRKELMLHAPMEPLVHRSWKHGLTLEMDESTLRRELRSMLDDLPEVKGANNHMGSALTANAEAMAWVMAELATRRLYFIDSRTTTRTAALTQAQLHSLPSAKRDVFLDNSRAPDAIAGQYQKLLSLARAKGSAIAIGHPYPETLSFLNNALANLHDSGVVLVPVSQLLDTPFPNDAAPRATSSAQ